MSRHCTYSQKGDYCDMRNYLPVALLCFIVWILTVLDLVLHIRIFALFALKRQSFGSHVFFKCANKANSKYQKRVSAHLSVFDHTSKDSNKSIICVDRTPSSIRKYYLVDAYTLGSFSSALTLFVSYKLSTSYNPLVCYGLLVILYLCR